MLNKQNNLFAKYIIYMVGFGHNRGRSGNFLYPKTPDDDEPAPKQRNSSASAGGRRSGGESSRAGGAGGSGAYFESSHKTNLGSSTSIKIF